MDKKRIIIESHYKGKEVLTFLSVIGSGEWYELGIEDSVPIVFETCYSEEEKLDYVHEWTLR